MFHYKNIGEIQKEAKNEGIYLPFGEDTAPLKTGVRLEGREIPNRIAIQPMEGCDGAADGKPDELTLRRYDKFAKSGAGLIWEEATAVWEEGRANPRQLWIKEENLDAFRAMNDRIREISMKENGFAPLIIMQATHSGRYSKPHGVPEPLIAYNSPIFEKDGPIPEERIVSDDYLKRLIKRMGEAAYLAQKAGFDGVDIKSCHRYLGSELLSAYTRPGIFGGSFENRTRFLRESVMAAKARVSGGFLVTSRLNIYDGFPYPYGFGVNEKDGLTPDLTEPKKLVRILHQELGVDLLDITIGNPYVNPHVNRPADFQPYDLPESPLVGVARMLDCTRSIQEAYPDLIVIGSGLSYLRQFAPRMAAGAVREGYFQIAGFGRMAFAYPDLAKEILSGEELDPKKCCIACGKCSQLMRFGSKAGCVVRDPVYTKLYQEAVQGQKPRL
ncbi:MAG TPA: flavin oxidoreductase/NADH oxidase [Candidatus Merdivicinus intestinigallinarum]|nr:flavin oxidoreductase/NADH oxidase [Candidatus Merdivicinus intestinigallinarum]